MKNETNKYIEETSTIDKHIIKVLWIDDEYSKFTDEIETFWSECKNLDGIKYQLEIIPYDNWVEGRDKCLKINKRKISAIILDAHCKYDQHSEPDDEEFIMNAFNEARKFSIPTFIFSIGTTKAKSISKFHYQEGEPMFEWEKATGFKYYNKLNVAEKEKLKFDIIKSYIRTEEWQLKYKFYNNVFQAVRELELNPLAENYLLSLLKPIHFPGIEFKDYHEKAGLLRKIMEHIFRAMEKYGLMPKIFLNKSYTEEVNISKCSNWILNSKFKVFPENLVPFIRSIQTLFQKFHHTEKDKTSLEFNSPYLIYSLAMWTCDFIVYLARYVKLHPDPKENRKKWPENPDKEIQVGKLHWDEKNNCWIIPYLDCDKKTGFYKVDNKNNKNTDNSYYRESALCSFHVKEVKTNKYAIFIDYVDEETKIEDGTKPEAEDFSQPTEKQGNEKNSIPTIEKEDSDSQDVIERKCEVLPNAELKSDEPSMPEQIKD